MFEIYIHHLLIETVTCFMLISKGPDWHGTRDTDRMPYLALYPGSGREEPWYKAMPYYCLALLLCMHVRLFCMIMLAT